MNTDKVGQAAGAIWKRLHEKGTTGLALTEIKKIAGYTTDEVVAGLGWLAREGKLSFREGPAKKLIVSLVGEESFV